MQGPTHLAVSWFLGEAAGLARARDRRIVAWAGFAPDVDVLAYVGALVWYRFDQAAAFENVWSVVHHRYTHNLAFVLVAGAVAWGLASRDQGHGPRLRVALLAMAACALHNFLDLVGAGPTWPIYPWWPLSPAPWSAEWSWTLRDAPNVAILAACLAGTLAYGWASGRSPLECFGDRADAWMVRVLREGRDTPASADAAARQRSRRLRWALWIGLALAAIAILAPLGFDPFG